MKLTQEYLAHFTKTKEILEKLAAETNRDIEWSNQASTSWMPPEVFEKQATYLSQKQRTFQKYKATITVLDSAITHQEISEKDLQTLSDTQIPVLVDTANRLKAKA
ncbi:MAG: hypothetical protein BGO43_14535 [Gammaproteobacteria bacterium 39-13]|nr:hypothetical protein [Gammaproteobacteria bacterium]OJV88511.1 MAG: hypothetical protein BGO43_14535 [Gammaproteobacteria bacterium 39-13]